MDFDPLSLFTPEPRSDEVREEFVFRADNNNDNASFIEDDAHLVPLHVLDLPLLQLKPSQDALMTLLLLLAPSDVYNFGKEDTLEAVDVDVDEVLIQKNIDIQVLNNALDWFTLHCPRLDTREKLAHIPNLSYSLKLSDQYSSYLTRIISNPLSWIDDPSLIHKQASLRLSENCGRTAQPEIIRRIALPNLEKYISGKYILLKEPSLTSDNLGLKTWGSSLILSKRLLADHTYLSGTVLELGSGTGLVGMMCQLLGFETYLTDLPEIIPNLKENVKLNNINAIVHELDWTNPSSFIHKFGNLTFDTIVVSDPIYSSKHPQWVVNMVCHFLKSGGKVLFQIPLRPQFENERANLWKLMLVGFEELEAEIEEGFDDFGELKFCFKVFKKLV